MKHQLKNTTNLISESGRAPSLRHVEAHLAETSHDITTEFVSQGPHGGKSPSGRRESGESGRSMVEMLGTLAIMGVLSIGGVVGYRYAMDKFNANTILSEISKRAMTASQQRLVGQPINLNEYGAAEIQGYTVGHTDNVDGDTAFFSLSVSNVPKGICDKVIQDKLRTATEVWLNTNTDVTEGGTCDDSENGNTIEFVFANTLDPNATPTEPTPAGPSCPAGSSTDSTTNTGGSFSVTVDTETIWCYCPAGKKYNTATNACDADITNTCSSWTTNECGAGKYCQFSPSSCESDPTSGTCQDIAACGTKGTYENFWMSDYSGSCQPDWWTAQAICAAKGKRLVSLGDIGCTRDSSCNTAEGSVIYNLQQAGMTHFIWTTDLYKENNPNSCTVFSVHVANSRVSLSYNRSDNLDVLCR